MNMDIERLIPQRVPFLFIDDILELQPLIYGCALTRIRGDEKYFAGHFPGNPVFPGVLMIEAAGQLANALVRADADFANSYLYYSKMSKVKFMGDFLPGDTMYTEVIISQHMDEFVFTHANIKKEDVKVFSADIVFRIMEGKE